MRGIEVTGREGLRSSRFLFAGLEIAGIAGIPRQIVAEDRAVWQQVHDLPHLVDRAFQVSQLRQAERSLVMPGDVGGVPRDQFSVLLDALGVVASQAVIEAAGRVPLAL